MEDSSQKYLDDTNCSDSKTAIFKTKKRSLVWNFFQKISRERVQCRLCKHEQNYQGTTGNILRHLKARHSLDATIKGQRDPQNQVLIRELMSMTTSASTLNNYEQKPIVRKTSVASDSSDRADPCTNNDNSQMQFQSFKNDNSIFYQELHEDCIYNDNRKEQEQKSARKEKLEENRILAETEYYREKAAYFRIQKHFTALQAKKVKLEIEQFVLNSNKN